MSLAVVGLTALAVSVTAGMAQAQSTPKFETASIKLAAGCEDRGGGPRMGITASPGRLSIACQTVDFLIRQAYLANGRDFLFISGRVFTQQIKGSPAWISSDHYAIDAKADGPQTRETMLGPMMQALLEDRFMLKTHRETREVPVYQLTAAKSGPKLEAAKELSCAPFDVDKPAPPPGKHLCGVLIRSVNPSVPTALYGATMADLCRSLSRLLDREVIDKTGIAGRFDVRMELSPVDLFPLTRAMQSGPDSTDPAGTSVFTAVRKLGLQLESGRGAAEFLVIDHIERPSAN